MNTVFKELLNLSEDSAKEVRVYPSKVWGLSLQCRPCLEDTAILRINHGIHTIAKSYLDLGNKFVVFDIDDVQLLLPWASLMAPMILVDPDANYAIPQGIMRVRVKLCGNSARIVRTSSDLPASIPKRQLVLVQMKHFESFLYQLRVMEMANGNRVMPGKTFRGTGGVPVNAMKGFHGLTIRVVVNPDFPADWTRPLLEHFRMFHGPLNEVCIIGSPDTEQARSIEASISLPRDESSLTRDEVLIHVARLISTANGFAADGYWVLASALYVQIRALPANSAALDYTPWAGWLPEDWSQNKFEVFLISVASLNSFFVSLQTEDVCYYASFATAMVGGPIQQALLFLSMGFDDINLEMRAWASFIVGLHCIFTARINNVAHDSPPQLEIIRAGIRGIEASEPILGNLPESDTVVFRAAADMCAELRQLDLLESKAQMIQAILVFSTELADLVREQKCLPKWRVHGARISQALLDRGILDHMTNDAQMTQGDQNRFVVVDVFDHDDEEEEGDFYCI